MRQKFVMTFWIIIALFALLVGRNIALAGDSEHQRIRSAIQTKGARWTAIETKISKLAPEERRKRLNLMRPPLKGAEKTWSKPSTTLPTKLDWRDYNGKGYVTPIKEQGDCSACWAFAPAAALESSVLISTNSPGTDLDLSEQSLLACAAAGTCGGGQIDTASDYIKNTGLPAESCLPYTSADSLCGNLCSALNQTTYKIANWYRVNATVEDIKSALYNKGPLVILLAAQTDFFYYQSGIYSNTWGAFEGYHSALVVGYNDDEKYFIIKSSWGTDWGEAGYARIAYSEIEGDTQFGFWTIAYDTAFPSGFPTINGIERNTTSDSGSGNGSNDYGTDGNGNGSGPGNSNNGGGSTGRHSKESGMTGTVRDEAGNAVQGAVVKIGNYTATSGTDGRYDLRSVPPGDYIAQVEKEDYASISESVTLEKHSVVTKDFVMITTSIQVLAEGSGNLGTLGPGWHNSLGKDWTPQEAQTYLAERRKKILSTKSAKAPMAGIAADYNNADLLELARGLRNDPKLIYDYVHNNIDYVPYYGSRKGAYQTYMDGSGNDFDQASLMIALLRAAGYVAQYIYGQMTIPGTDISNWFGVDLTSTTIHNVLTIGGIPHTTPLTDGQTTLDRVWVKATINGEEYLFDPTFKAHTYQSKIDIGTAMGYSRTALLSAAGGTIGDSGYSIQNMTESVLRTQLETYAGNLASTIRSQYPNADLNQIISGRKIVQTKMTAYQTTLPYSPVITTGWPKDDVPVEMTSVLSIGFCSNPNATTEPWPESYNCNQDNSEIFATYNTPDLSGKRLTLTFGSTGIAQFCIDGSNCLNGTSTTPSTMYFKIKVDHPATTFDQRVRYTVNRGTGGINKYAVVYNFGGASDALLKKRQQLLDTYRSQGATDDSEAVRGETLNVMGQTWLKEVAMTNNILSSMAETVGLIQHNVGLMCQEAGYYIDVKVGLFSSTSKHNPSTDNSGHFLDSAFFGSAFEHGMLEQLMGSDKPAASTIKLLQIANAGGGKIFYVNSISKDAILGTASDCSDSQLTGYSCSNDIANQWSGFRVLAAGGHSFILPASGQLVLNQWKGKGYIDRTSSSMGMIIGGNYFGGYGSYQGYVYPSSISYYTYTNTYTAPAPVNISRTVTPVKISTSRDPVDMAGGAFLCDRTDLSLGGAAPSGLAFSRSYTSSNNTTKRSMGYGWTHNYDIYLSPSSHSEPVFGSRQPLEAIGLITAIYASLDLLRNQDDIQGWMTAALSTKWAIDQMIDNAVTVNLGHKAMEFIKLPDGTFSAPPGITSKLTYNGSTYSLQERSGTTMSFNTDKKISQITDIDNNAMNFFYSGGKLQTVTDAFSRTLTLSYTGDNLTSVVDSSSPARTVSYGYTGYDLTTYTDPENQPWFYGYNTDHRLRTLTNPLSVTTATNVYDTLGRVMTQTVPRQGGGTATYNFYFSGYRNQEVDPAGNALTYYYDAKGREYAQEDALGNKVTKVFDGQDHVTTVTDPLSNSTKYEYDGNQNLTVITDALTNKTKNFYKTAFPYLLDYTQDPLSHTTYYSYDTLNRYHLTGTLDAANRTTGASYYTSGLSKGLLQTATDGRGTVTTFTYDAKGNPYTSKVGSHPVVTYAYDTIGRMTSLTDQVSTITGPFVYDKRSLLTSITYPLTPSQPSIFHYDNAGRLDYKTDRKNATINYSYTPSDKLDTITYPDSTTVHFNYNNLDQLTSVTEAGTLGTTNYSSYDAAGRLKTFTDPRGFAISYDYDPAGNVSKITYPGTDKTVSYTYDQLNRLETVKIDWLSKTTTYRYDAAGRLGGAGNPITNFNSTQTFYGYDNGDALTSLENKTSSNATIATYAFTLDGNGNQTGYTRTEPQATTLTEGTTNYTYNTQKNRLSSDGTNSFTYDNEGQISSGYGNTYTFDYEHRLTAIGSTASFVYDSKGNRLQATRNGTVTKYIYDASGNLIAEADSSNNITRYYIYGKGLLAMVTSAGSLYVYHYNANGSTIAMTDSSQAIVNKYAYDPYGNVVNQTEAVTQPFKYVGQFGVMTESNGFYYMRARYYDPKVARFVSEDPLGFDGGDVNLSAYVAGNPVMGVDPDGLAVIINITRTTYTDKSIISKIKVYSTVTGSTFSGYALENANPPNPNLPVQDGSYSAFVRSDHSPKRIELTGVPGASNVQIHTGNSPSDVIGCFAVGTSTSKDWVSNSKSAMNQINKIVSGDRSGQMTVNVSK